MSNLALKGAGAGWLLFFIFGVLLSSCSAKKPAGKSTESTPMAQKGKALYMSQCIACHHTNPSQDGNIGPAIAGSSFELLKLRVLEGKYPPGYQPKRNTTLMVPLPQLTDEDIRALYEYLNSP